MSYNPKVDALLALAIAMDTGDASEGLEAVQSAEQRRARRNLMLPRNMNPSKEAFEALGFTFEDIDDDVLCKATLPNGWKLESDGVYWTYLIDEKGRKRGSYFYKGAFYDRNGHMSLSSRFHPDYTATDEKNWKGPFTVFVKDADGSIPFTAGQCTETYSDEYYSLMDQAKEYLRTTYPEWENPTKYWD